MRKRRRKKKEDGRRRGERRIWSLLGMHWKILRWSNQKFSLILNWFDDWPEPSLGSQKGVWWQTCPHGDHAVCMSMGLEVGGWYVLTKETVLGNMGGQQGLRPEHSAQRGAVLCARWAHSLLSEAGWRVRPCMGKHSQSQSALFADFLSPFTFCDISPPKRCSSATQYSCTMPYPAHDMHHFIAIL